MSAEITFSIILPVYNVQKYVDKCIKSILKQSYENFEIICVDDASPDDSMRIVDRFTQHDSRIKIIRHPDNKGLGAARNTALNEAQGKYLCCIDSDDWIEPDYLKKIYDAFTQNNVTSVWVKYWMYKEKTDTAVIPKESPCLCHHLGGLFEIDPEHINDFPAYAWNKAYITKIVKENKMHWLENKFFEDVYFYYDYFMANPNIYIVDDMLYYYRDRAGSITDDMSNLKKVQDMFDVCFEIYKLIEQKGDDTGYKGSIVRYAKRFKAQYIQSDIINDVEKIYQAFEQKIDSL